MSGVPEIILRDGKNMPIIGLGTWQSEPGQVYEAVKAAIEVGYRHIDGAMIYQNEVEVGKAINEKIADGTIKRKDIFVTSKLWNTFHKEEKAIEGCRKTLEDLGLDYVDLYLVHWPIAFQEGDELIPTDENGVTLIEDVDICETWKGMETCHKNGLAKSIGLSNFNSEQIQKILDNCVIKPTVLQVECHPYLNQAKLIEFCNERSIFVTAYSPLGAPARPWVKSDEPSLLEDPKIKEIAEVHNKSPAQILIRFQIQRGVIVIPKSVTPERIKSNFEVFDFVLESDEMDVLSNMDESFRYCALEWFKGVPNYPFSIEY